jgi:hypothetical protein
MLDVIGHHREHGGDEEKAEIAVLERRESDFFIDGL